MNALFLWFKSKNINSHAIAAVVISAAGLVMTDEQARNFVLSLFASHPKIGTAIVALAGIIFKYSHSSSPAGTVAQAKTVLASPDAPSAAAVDALTKPQ